jgi:hypothetical protein
MFTTVSTLGIESGVPVKTAHLTVLAYSYTVRQKRKKATPRNINDQGTQQRFRTGAKLSAQLYLTPYEDLGSPQVQRTGE